VQCVFASLPPIPIYLGTRVPKVKQLAASFGDGIIYTGEVSTLGSRDSEPLTYSRI
jgi:hypothetical protein